MDELFVTFSAPGVPGTPLGHPGHRNSPKTSPKSLRDPPGRQFFMIFGQFLTPVFGSCCCFVGLFSLSLCHVRTKNAVGTVAEIARRATGYYLGLRILSYIIPYYLYYLMLSYTKGMFRDAGGQDNAPNTSHRPMD